MIVGKVVDASAVACLCFEEPELTAVAAQLRGAHLFAPAILDFELATICWKRLRRQPNDAPAIMRQFAVRNDFLITVAAVDFTAVVDLAKQTKLSACDASYLWLARTLDVELVTLDQQLARVAAKTH